MKQQWKIDKTLWSSIVQNLAYPGSIFWLRRWLVLFSRFLCSWFLALVGLLGVWESLLVCRAVVEVHFREGLINFDENVPELRMVNIVGDDCENRAELLVLLLQSQLLVHVCDALLKTSLEGWDLVAQLLFLLFWCVLFLKCVLELVDALRSLLAVLGEALDLASAFHSSCHLHAAVHLVCDLGERGHVLTRVVAEVEAACMQDFRTVELDFASLAFGTTANITASKRLRIVILAWDTLTIISWLWNVPGHFLCR